MNAESGLIAVTRLKKMIESKHKALATIQGKRLWRPSEKAMAAAGVQMDIDALGIAIQAIAIAIEIERIEP